MVATPFPIKLVMARASDMNLSTPNKRASPSTGITSIAVRVDASTMNPLPVTPAAPFEVIIRMPMMVSICSSESWTLNTCERKITAIER